MKSSFLCSLLTLAPFLAAAADDPAHELISWEKRHLDHTFYSEGACHGDIDRDGHIDLVSGPFVWFGPAFDRKLEIYPPEPVDSKGYSHNFFSYAHDFNGDAWLDILVIGFPGRDSRWFENPRGKEGHWNVHPAMAQTDNESPTFLDVTGDGIPEIVCQVNGQLGYASPQPDKPTAPFVWHPISPEGSVGGKFTHGLGVGDVNGDGRLDILEKERWWEQPASLDGDPLWESHRFALATPGGAQMYAYDFDGDGDHDILTSLAAHAYGLAWYENVDGKLTQRLIMGQDPLENKYGLAFSQLHAIALADVDGDGVKDVITGKRYWAHGGKDPGGTDPAVLYWFRTVRSDEGVDFVPYQIDNDSGVGTEVDVGDVNGDGYLDIIIGNKKGTFLHLQKRQKADKQAWLDVQPEKAFLDGIVPMEAYAEGAKAEEAAGAMTLPEGFTATLLASEPELTQPITFCWDARGRLWIAEAHNYPTPAKAGEPGKDRIVIFEDADGNGSFETRTVFTEGLSLVSGLEVGFGGVWVGAAPHFLFIPDRNGDDVPDANPVILLDGWGVEDTHETLNSFSWGPDGWLYGLHGVFTHSWVGKPGTPKEERPYITCNVWRYHPTRHEFEVFASGTSNPWGLDFDQYGQAFISACVIPHLWHVVQGAYYQRQGGQHVRKHLYELLETTARHRHYGGQVADHAHWGVTPTADIITGDTFSMGGGHAHCGLTIYAGGSFPARYDGALMMFNLHGHRINVDQVIRHQSGYYGDRRPDFLFANDHWFIGTHLDYGPDGALYFTDWQDDTTCHRQNDLEWDRSNGRLYRVHYGEHRPVRIDLAQASDGDLVAYQTHKNEWYARQSRRLLQERGPLPDELTKQLWTQVYEHRDVAMRLRALWTLHATGQARSGLESLLAEGVSEYVRAWAVRLLGEEPAPLSIGILKRLVELAGRETSPFVRRHLASLLQRLPAEHAWPVAEALAQHAEDTSDPMQRLMLWYGVEPLVAEDPARAFVLAKTTAIPKLREFIIRRAAAIPGGYEKALAQAEDPGMAEIVVRALATQLAQEARVPMPESWPKVYNLLSKDAKPELKQSLLTLAGKFGDQRLTGDFRALLEDTKQSVEMRRAALRTLVDMKDGDSVPALHRLLDGPESPLRAEAIDALGTLQNQGTATRLIGAYNQLTANERTSAMNVLAMREESAGALLQAVGSGTIPRQDVSVATARQLLQLKSNQVAQLLEQHWGAVTSSGSKIASMKAWKERLTKEYLASANRSNGRRLYNQTCAACHQLFGQGVAIGPDITGANRGALDYLLENILDPNALVPLDYQLTTFTLKDASVISGMIRGSSDTAHTVALPGGTETTVAKADVVNQETLAQSLMPEGILEALSVNDARDLIAYLQSSKQVRLAQPGEILLEGETLKVVKKTGNTTAQAMGSFPMDSWSNDSQLWWTGGRPGDKLVLEFTVPESGAYQLAAVFTKAVDYGKVRLALDDEAALISEELDFYYGNGVVTTGELSFRSHELSAGKHHLIIDLLGKHPSAAPGYMVGLDYLLLTPVP